MEALPMPTSITTAVNVVSEVAHAMRIELSFLLFFGGLYLLNRLFFPKSLTTNRKHMGKAGPTLRHSTASLQRGAAVARSTASSETVGSRRRPVTSEAQPTKAHFAATTTAQTQSAASVRSFEEATQELRNPRPEQLRDPEWFSKAVLALKSVQVLRTVEVYKSAMRLGLDLSQLSPSKGEEVFVALVTAAIRANQPMEALDMLKTCKASGFRISIGLAASATKLCTSKQYYKECLMIYDFLQEDGSLTLDERSVWSCLLFCAVEARAFNRCSFFWKQMQSCGTPSNKDYGNMIRFASNQREWQLTLSLISEMQKKGVDVDNVVYNTALATCVSAGRTDEARTLLEEMEASEGVVDVITYNTLAKGYAKGGKMTQCFDLYEHMRERGITPSEVTYGILLDCCINENQMEKADKVFNRMTQEGCVMNTVLYTTLIKGFARARQVDQAMRVYKKMLDDRAITPDLITFSILIKANCDAGGLAEAMELLETMRSLKLTPDEVIFNNLLSGCVQKNDQELGKRLYHDMVKGGLRPSNATFSIMLRLYSSCKLLEEALELLRNEPAKFGVEPEQRLFVQLAQACLRERQGRVAVEVYSLMVKHGSPTPAMTGSLLAMCSKLNMLGTGAELLDLAAKAKVKVDERDIKDLRQTAVRKKKANFVEQIDACQTLILGARK